MCLLLCVCVSECVVSHVISCLCTLFLWHFCFETVFLLNSMLFNVYPFSMFITAPGHIFGDGWIGGRVCFALSIYSKRFDYILLCYLLCALKTFFFMCAVGHDVRLDFLRRTQRTQNKQNTHAHRARGAKTKIRFWWWRFYRFLAFIIICDAFLTSAEEGRTEEKAEQKKHQIQHRDPEPKSCLCVGLTKKYCKFQRNEMKKKTKTKK